MRSNALLYWENLLMTAVRLVWFTLCELVSGVVNERINVVRYLYPGTAVAVFFALRGDLALAWLTGLDALALGIGMRTVVVYTSVFAGWFIWAGERAYHRAKILARLRDAFLYCGLEANKKFPAFIDDRPIDEYVRRLRLFANNIPLKKFQENKENLEAHLNVSIVKMTEEVGDKSRINIIYAIRELESPAVLEATGFANGVIPIGVSFEGPIKVNLRDVAHVLVAGQTGGGKSNFLKTATSVLTKNNNEAEVLFLDFKGGMELADLTNHLGESYSNFFKFEGPKACTEYLSKLGERIESRLTEIARVGASSLDEYQLKQLVANKNVAETTEVVKSGEGLKRTYIIIDEIAQLYAKDPSVPKAELAAARAAVNRVARQGRAAGVHLIVATQKPDSASFDQTVKANLPGILCFPMVSQAASVSALGTKRAFDLNPEIKGRAVWKYGSKTQEVQTYLFQ